MSESRSLWMLSIPLGLMAATAVAWVSYQLILIDPAYALGVTVVLGGAIFWIFQLLVTRHLLRDHGAQSRSLFDQIPVSMFLHDPQTGAILDANSVARQVVWGDSEQRLPGQSIWSMPSPYSEADALAWIRKAGQEGPQRFEWCSSRQSSQGELIWEVLTLNAVHLEGKRYILATAVDITDRKRTEQALQRETGLVQSLLDSIPDLIFYKNTVGVYLGCNPAFATFVGRPRMAIIGKTDYDLFAQETAEAFRFFDQQMLDTLQPRRNEEWVTYPDGRRCLLDTLKLPYRGLDGKLLGILGISRDITERHETQSMLEQSLEQARQLTRQAQAANRAKNVFLANMSHEIRTPMNAIFGFAQLLSQDVTLSLQQQRMLESILHGSRQLLGLLDDILALARVETRRLDRPVERFSIRTLLQGLAQAFAERARHKGLLLVVHVDPQLPTWVRGDIQKIKRILTHLLVNAVKFTEQGQICLRALSLSSAPHSDESVTGQQHLATGTAHSFWVALEVEDTGAGLEGSEIEQLFNPFWQGERHAHLGGVGLGLPLSQQWAQMLDGVLMVSSELGVGSCFQLQIPLEHSYMGDEAEDSPPPDTNSPGNESAIPAHTAEPSVQHAPAFGLAPDAVQALPTALVLDLREAVECGDMQGFRRHLAQIPPQQNRLRTALQALADVYDYEQLMEVLQARCEV